MYTYRCTPIDMEYQNGHSHFFFFPSLSPSFRSSMWAALPASPLATSDVSSPPNTCTHTSPASLPPFLPPSLLQILDVGCSAGISTRYLRRLFPSQHLTGLDLSPFFLAVAQLREEETPMGIEYVHAKVGNGGREGGREGW